MYNKKDLAKEIGRSVEWIDEQIQQHKDFPKPCLLRGNFVWDLHDVCLWIGNHLPEQEMVVVINKDHWRQKTNKKKVM